MRTQTGRIAPVIRHLDAIDLDLLQMAAVIGRLSDIEPHQTECLGGVLLIAQPTFLHQYHPALLNVRTEQLAIACEPGGVPAGDELAHRLGMLRMIPGNDVQRHQKPA